MTNPLPSSILITGASSGIGAALARAYAAPERSLFLSGRNPERLSIVAEICRNEGARVEALCVDVTDEHAMQDWIGQADDTAPLDLVVANAGISGGTAGTGSAPPDQATRIFAVNVSGVENTVAPALARMQSHTRGGQIAIMSSLASFRGFAGAPAYCASKAAVRVYGEGLRAAAAAHRIRVSVICPGFIRSRMTDGNAFPMPMLMDSDKAARIIVRGLLRNKARIAFPFPMYAAALAMQAMPSTLADHITRALPAKD